MSKILLSFFLSFVLIGSATAQSQQPQPSTDTLTSPNVTGYDSASAGSESLPPLTLESAYDTSAQTRSSLLPLEGSWMSEPKGARPGQPPLEFLLEPFTYEPTYESAPSLHLHDWLLNSRANLMSPWTLQMESRSKYSILRTILGSVQIGGMAYLMYLHFKKYGLR